MSWASVVDVAAIILLDALAAVLGYILGRILAGKIGLREAYN